ncbi:MAG TPA: hypothetical protein VMV59_04610 [Candidatus Dormibacteraeota bacterium]|nr:hypothetical protein [Candidatus Dormibacteraeota bacterium]
MAKQTPWKSSFPTLREISRASAIVAGLFVALIFAGLLISHYSGGSKPASIVLASAPAAVKPIPPPAPLSAAQRIALAKRQAVIARQNAVAMRNARRNARRIWAREVDSKLLDAGIESTTKTEGPRDTILVIQCALAGRVMEHQISSTDFPVAAEALGFKKLILTNGFGDDLDETFTWDLTK